MIRVAGRAVDLWRRGGGAPLLYLHGLADVHALPPERRWPFLERLAGHFDLVAPAHPGYGQSTPLPADADVEDWVLHYVDLLEALGTQPLAVVGHSLGGWLAAELALRRPDLVTRLVLLAPLGAYVRGEAPARFFGAAAPRGLGGFGEVRGVLFADGESATARATLPDDMAREEQVRWFAGLAGAARLGWKGPQLASRKLLGRLGRVRSPTLLAVGDADRLLTPALVVAWRDAIAPTTSLAIPGAGHALPVEQPEALAEHVIAFLHSS